MPPEFQELLDNLPALFLSLVTLLLTGIIWILVIVFGIIKWAEVKGSFWRGVGLGTLIYLLTVPNAIVSVLALNRPHDAAVYVGVAFGLLFGLLNVPHAGLSIGLGKFLQSPGRMAYPLLHGQSGWLRGWMVAILGGLVAGGVSVVAFNFLDVKESWLLRDMTAGYNFDAIPKPLLMLVVLGFVTSAAIAEEILYRGLIQAWLMRMMGHQRAGAIAAVVLTSFFWAIAHALNAEPAWIKILQIFIIGLFIGWLAWRHSVEAGMVAHISLNVVAMVDGVMRM